MVHGVILEYNFLLNTLGQEGRVVILHVGLVIGKVVVLYWGVRGSRDEDVLLGVDEVVGTGGIGPPSLLEDLLWRLVRDVNVVVFAPTSRLDVINVAVVVPHFCRPFVY